MIKVEDYVKLRKKIVTNEARSMISFVVGLIGLTSVLPGFVFYAMPNEQWAKSAGNAPAIMIFVGIVVLLIAVGIAMRQSKTGTAVALENKKFYSNITEKYGFTLAPGEKIVLGDPTAFEDGEPVQVLSTFKEDKTLTSITVFVEGDEFAFYSSEGQKLSVLVGNDENR